ncbi:N-methyl-L-tryptophan oxidase [Raineyella fluvialis]|uniref:N-methyl-L-tryptophan oxidase n=1 Tax=Raineyella fluvialis TaxID=2662261 RepID=A0A5Q2FCA3_9ACTN|nr:N-methyl-L-tryptophan oxidase [Raineyella fluvialis]QGF23054.1 N-methyl-L-tryptophan oxidase [Raineyella fluvialis]
MNGEDITAVDVVVVGVGTMGSMALWQLSQVPGLRVLGIEQFGPAHTYGSFSGESRLYRAAAKEGRIYIPALLESRRLWQELEAESGRRLLLPVGALSIGPEGHEDLASTLAAIREYDLPHRVLDAAELAATYPQFAVRPGDIGILDELGGGLRPELAVMSATERAVARGAEVRYHTEVLGLAEDGDGVTVSTSTGTIRARRVVVTAGSWTTRVLPELRSLIHVEAYALTWFMPRHLELFTPERFPVFMRDLDGVHAFGAPSLDGYSIKMCPHLMWPPLDHPSQVPATISPEQLAWAGEWAQRMIPDLVPDPVRWSVHHDSVSPDHVPVIDRVGAGHIVVATGMSGNGFKFAPVYGRVVAELATQGASALQHPMFTLAGHLDRAGVAA